MQTGTVGQFHHAWKSLAAILAHGASPPAGMGMEASATICYMEKIIFGCASTREAMEERRGRCRPYMLHHLAGSMVLAFMRTVGLEKTPSRAW